MSNGDLENYRIKQYHKVSYRIIATNNLAVENNLVTDWQLVNAEGFTDAATGELPPFSTQMSYYYCISVESLFEISKF